jgi:hypothetical protein
MTKYLFYAAFLWFCWYAGNKAFPPTPQQPTSNTRSDSTWVRSVDEYSTAPQNVHIQRHSELVINPGKERFFATPDDRNVPKY